MSRQTTTSLALKYASKYSQIKQDIAAVHVLPFLFPGTYEDIHYTAAEFGISRQIHWLVEGLTTERRQFIYLGISVYFL